MKSKIDDKKFMSLAINLAKKNLGQTSPNPVVGAVLVKDGEIIATAITAHQGRPHAERLAIQKVNDQQKIHGSTLYSTLEPCCHFGQTPPCTDLIIKSGISRVVIANCDPDLRVNSKGITRLKAAGIEVVENFMAKEAEFLNRGFFLAKTIDLPFITLKIATSLDGKIAAKSGDSKWISNESTRKFAHLLRSQHEAIMVGGGTVKTDNPKLDCRIHGLENQSPARIILSASANFDFKESVFLRNNLSSDQQKSEFHLSSQNFDLEKSDSKIFNLKESSVKSLAEKSANQFNRPIILITSAFNQNSPALKNWLELNQKNQAIFFANKKSPSKSLNNSEKSYDPEKFDLIEVFRKVVELGINSVMVEGGSNFATQLLVSGLINQLIWVRNSKIIGNDGLPAFGNLGFDKINQSLNLFSKRSFQECEGDLIEFFSKN